MSQPVLRLQDVRRLLRLADEYELDASAVQRLKWFQYNLEHEGNVSLTCRHFGISRSTYVRWSDRFDPTNLRTLDDYSKRPHTVRQPHTDARTLELIRQIRIAEPLLGKEIIAEMLQKEHGITVSSSTVGRIIKRHHLFFAQTASHETKRASMDETPAIRLPVSEEPEADVDDPFLSLSPGLTS